MSRRSTIVNGQFLLDQFTGAAAAYSLRRLRNAYTGNCIRVRRSSDNAELDIGFTSTGVLDTAALLAHVGAGDGFVTNLYDNTVTNNLINTSSANQPQIVSSGVLTTSGGTSAIQGAATRALRTTSNLAISTASEIWLFFVLDINNVTTAQSLFETSPNYNFALGAIAIYIDSGNLEVGQKNTNYSLRRCTITTGRRLVSIRIRTGQTINNFCEVYFNGVAQTMTNLIVSPSIAFTDHIAHFGGRNANSFGFLGKYQEFLIFNTDQTANRTAIENNIMKCYGI